MYRDRGTIYIFNLELLFRWVKWLMTLNARKLTESRYFQYLHLEKEVTQLCLERLGIYM